MVDTRTLPQGCAGVKLTVCLATMLVAMTTCDLGIVLEITGGLSATALAYLVSHYPKAYRR